MFVKNCNKIKQQLHSLNNISVNPQYTCKADSGATKHYIREKDFSLLTDVQCSDGPTVKLPDNSVLKSTKSGLLPIPNVTVEGRRAHIIPGLQSASLLSMGQLCDDDCEVRLRKNDMEVHKDNKVILLGKRNYTDGLWDVKIDNNIPDKHNLNVIVDISSIKNLIEYYHACLYSPPKSTWLKALENENFPTWPGLTIERVRRFYPDSVATAKGHLDQEQQHLRSTKPTVIPLHESEQAAIIADSFPAQDGIDPTHQHMCMIMDFQPSSKAYFDLTGKFPYKSSRGNQYIMVFYNYDANYINAIAVKTRQAAELKNAFCTHTDTLRRSGINPSLYILDNEISNDLKAALAKYNIAYQLVPPAQHRRNAAERAIRTFKNHFLAGLATLPPMFPMSEWDRLLEQALLSLNLLRNARLNSKLSAHAFVHGIFDFNKHPLAPPGAQVIAHEKATHRKSWDIHGKDGWYMGPAFEHYRCVRVFIPTTGQERICDTVKFIPGKIPIPKVSTTDYLLQAAKDIVTLLKQPQKLDLPHHPGVELNDAIRTTADLLQRAAKKPQANIPPPAPPLPPKNQQPETPQPNVPNIITDDDSPNAPLPRVNVTTQLSPTQRPYLKCMQATNFNNKRTNMLVALEMYQHHMAHIYNKYGQRETIETLLNGPMGKIWAKSVSNEFGRLAKGNKYGVAFTDTIEFIAKSDVPVTKKVTYASFRFDHRPLKEEQYRARLVVGGDKLPYDKDSSSPAASLLETKLLVNSVISDANNGARFLTTDLKDFFLATPMATAEYMKIPYKYFPADIIEYYHLAQLVAPDGYVYIKIKKGMYGLKQAAVLAYEHLIHNLQAHGYSPILHTTGMWEHKTRKTKFCLCVDDFGIKYYSKEDADHLLHALQANYKVTTDWKGEHYCGLTLKWNYEDGYVDVSMPGYIEKIILKYFGNQPHLPTKTPYKYNTPFYDGGTQYVKDSDTSEALNKENTTRIQAILGSLLYYARAIEHPMLPALNELATEQAKPTQNTRKKVNQLLQYAATYPNSVIRFKASDMILHVDSDAAYLVLPNARSRIAGYYYFSDIGATYHNAPFLILCKTLKHVVTSAAEAETGGLFLNAQEIISLRYILTALGHPQPPTPLKTDNSTTNGYVHNNIKIKKAKAWDMRFNWLREKVAQNNLRIFWASGTENFADYFTKHFPTKYHEQKRSLLFHTK